MREVCDQLEISPSKVYDLIARGELRTVKIGRALRITQADIDAFIEGHALND